MVVKFFPSKKGGGTASIDYLLDKRTQQGTARILKGDEKLTRELIKSMKQKHKTCVGCLSFEEKNIDENTKKELMQSFENMLLTPQMQGRYNILWVEHTDKGRLELNFVIPKIDLESKKAFNPYFHMADLKRKDLWTDFVNLKHNLSNPKDPAKENTIQGSKKEIALFNDYKAIDSFLHEQVSKGLLTSRKSIVELLKANSVEITREGKDYISLKLPDSQKAKRFKGGIYDEQFTSIAKLSQISTEHRERERAFNERDITAELERLKQELNNHIQSKARYYYERNSKQALQQRENTSSVQMEQSSNELYFGNANDDDFKRDCMVSVDKTLSSIEREHSSNQKRGDIYSHTQEPSDRTEQRNLHSNQIRQGKTNDNTRSRTYSRSREIAKRTRECFNSARANTERKQRVTERTRDLQGFSDRISQFRELIYNSLKRLRDRIKKLVRKQEQEREMQRYR